MNVATVVGEPRSIYPSEASPVSILQCTATGFRRERGRASRLQLKLDSEVKRLQGSDRLENLRPDGERPATYPSSKTLLTYLFVSPMLARSKAPWPYFVESGEMGVLPIPQVVRGASRRKWGKRIAYL